MQTSTEDGPLETILIASPLTSLLKGKPAKLKWSEEATKVFNKLYNKKTIKIYIQNWLLFLSILIPNSGSAVVEVDTSDCGIGAVLLQCHSQPEELYSCMFFSRKLTSAKRSYDVGNKELLSMKAAIEEWRHWLKRAIHPFQVTTDHKNLEYIKSAKHQACWSLSFTRFQFTATYRPGSKNSKVDAFSRHHDPPAESISLESILPPSVIIAPAT